MSQLIKVGMTIDGINITSHLAEGGQATIWRVRELDGSRELACKLVSTLYESRNTPLGLKRLGVIEREIEILKDLQHRFIAKVFRLIGGQPEGHEDVFLRGYTTEVSPIGTLKQVLADGKDTEFKSFAFDERVRIASQITDAIVHIHDLEIVNSDIKAENVLVTSQGGLLTPILIDFGGAFRPHEPWPGYFTESYASFELRHKQSEATRSSDIYALGVLILEIFSGKRQFQPSSETIDMLNLSDIASEYTPFLKRMLSNNPEIRPSAKEVRSALERRRASSTISRGGDKDAINFPWAELTWNPEVHKKLGCSKVFVFLRGTRPTAEAKLLKSTLEKFGIYGGSIHRLLGNFDFLVDAWIDSNHISTLEDACRQFLLDHTALGTEPRFLTCDLLFNSFPRKSMSIPMDADALLHNIYRLTAETYINGGKEELIKKNFAMERKERRSGLLFFMEIRALSRSYEGMTLSEGAIEHYAGEIYKYITSKLTGGYKQSLKIYATNERNGFIICVTVPRLTLYRDIMLGTARHLRKKATNDADKFSFNTHIDLDGQGFLPSDDGMIPSRLIQSFL